MAKALGSTVILPCSCKNEYQDELYGKGMRVHSIKKKEAPACSGCTLTNSQKRLRAHAAAHNPKIHNN